MLYRRASEYIYKPAEVDAMPLAPSAPLPEAPASVNVRLMLHGYEVQVTLRGSDETQVLDRLAALLARYPRAAAAPPDEAPPDVTAPAQTPPQASIPTCPTHGPMKSSTKAPGTFYCTKKLYDGSYCQSRHP